MSEEFVYLKIPADDWRQIVSDIEDMARGEAEILEGVRELDQSNPVIRDGWLTDTDGKTA